MAGAGQGQLQKKADPLQRWVSQEFSLEPPLRNCMRPGWSNDGEFRTNAARVVDWCAGLKESETMAGEQNRGTDLCKKCILKGEGMVDERLPQLPRSMNRELIRQCKELIFGTLSYEKTINLR